MGDKPAVFTEISDFLWYYWDSAVEKTGSKLMQVTRAYEVHLVYKELERVMPKLSYEERRDLTLHHIKNETEFYKRVTEPVLNEK